MSTVERLEAELALAKLEAKFGEAQASDKVTKKMKDDLREARRVYRSEHRPQVAVNPDAVGTTAGVEGVGS